MFHRSDQSQAPSGKRQAPFLKKYIFDLNFEALFCIDFMSLLSFYEFMFKICVKYIKNVIMIKIYLFLLIV